MAGFPLLRDQINVYSVDTSDPTADDAPTLVRTMRADIADLSGGALMIDATRGINTTHLITVRKGGTAITEDHKITDARDGREFTIAYIKNDQLDRQKIYAELIH